jgi:hypothetical protein
MNPQAVTQVLEQIANRFTYAVDQQDYELLRFTVGELEDVVHNLKLEINDIRHIAVTEEQINAHLEFMGKADE